MNSKKEFKENEKGDTSALSIIGLVGICMVLLSMCSIYFITISIDAMEEADEHLKKIGIQSSHQFKTVDEYNKEAKNYSIELADKIEGEDLSGEEIKEIFKLLNEGD